MTTLQGILAFSMTARHASFARAARELGLTPSTLAKSVARLEQHLGLRLFHRTTRKVSLTPDGLALFERCSRIIEDIDALQSAADDARRAVRGTLRISVPIAYGRLAVLPVLIEMVRDHPELQLDVRFSDQRVDLISAGLDAAVRIGPLDDSRLVARKMGTQQIVTCASPEYLQQHGRPRNPEELVRHRCLVYRIPTSGRERAWYFTVAEERVEIAPPPSIVMDLGEGLVSAATAGAGIAQVPDYYAREGLDSGALVEVLKSHRPARDPIWIVYPTSRHMPARVRVLVERLVAPTPSTRSRD